MENTKAMYVISFIASMYSAFVGIFLAHFILAYFVSIMSAYFIRGFHPYIVIFIDIQINVEFKLCLYFFRKLIAKDKKLDA